QNTSSWRDAVPRSLLKTEKERGIGGFWGRNWRCWRRGESREVAVLVEVKRAVCV
ncbi:MAG: hypothetical protein ACI97A_004249, partial [Planctomycetota bacterium]